MRSNQCGIVLRCESPDPVSHLYNPTVVELRRTVRFFLNGCDPDPPPDRHNGFAAWPPVRGLGRFYQIAVICCGPADPVTGYFINIKEIDDAVRQQVLPYLRQIIASPRTDDVPMGRLMQGIVDRLQPGLRDSVREARLALSPYHSLTLRSAEMNRVVIREQFEFAAAHRLNVESLSEDENRRIFGKCNNPSGHGHNYHLEVAVSTPIGEGGQVPPVDQLDALVDIAVIQRFDHKHLNVDVPEFSSLNPSVENIAMVIYNLLSHEVIRIGAELIEVSVWETSKTVCTYRGETRESVPPA